MGSKQRQGKAFQPFGIALKTSCNIKPLWA